MMHNPPARPAISINTLCFAPAPLDRHVEAVARLGVGAISPGIEDVRSFGIADTARLLRDANLTAATLTHRAFAFATDHDTIAARERLLRTIGVAAAIGAQTITLTTGGRGTLTWTEAAARFADGIAPCAAEARASGVKLSLEPTSHLYADASIAHRLNDTLALVQAADIHLGIDMFACWFDADIEAAIAAAAPRTALVQVSDYVLGDRGLPCRAVPGDGAIPLARLLPIIHGAGFRGYYDIEVIGPRLEAEGIEAGLSRAIAHVGQLVA